MTTISNICPNAIGFRTGAAQAENAPSYAPSGRARDAEGLEFTGSLRIQTQTVLDNVGPWLNQLLPLESAGLSR